MSELNGTITQQLEQLQTLMHRMVFHGFMGDGKAARNPYRGQGRVLAFLARKPEITQKELTELMGMSKQSLAELLSKLEKTGYIERRPSQQDKRSVVILLLDKGKEAARELTENPGGVDRIFDCLEQEEQQQFSAYLERLIRRCAEYFPGEDIEQQRERMGKFLARHNYSFSRIDLNGSIAAEHQALRQKHAKKEE